MISSYSERLSRNISLRILIKIFEAGLESSKKLRSRNTAEVEVKWPFPTNLFSPPQPFMI